MRISDWSSDVCSSDLACGGGAIGDPPTPATGYFSRADCDAQAALGLADGVGIVSNKGQEPSWTVGLDYKANDDLLLYIVSRRGYRGANVNTPRFETPFTTGGTGRSEEHTSELQSLMRTSYAVFCLKKKKTK